jgi:Glycosyltransferase family 87
VRRLWLAAGVVALCLVVVFALYRLSFIVTFPDEQLGMDATAYGVGVAAHELLGRPGGTDLVVDYAAAHAMTHGGDAYAIAGDLIHAIGMDYPYGTANPHPPTTLSIVLPLTLVNFNRAEQIFAFAMLLAYIATIALVGVRMPLAVAGGIAVAVSMPGAYGLNNVVPMIGVGVALAWRFRDQPLLAGLGIALAATPKSSGLILLLPFAVSGRFKAAAWGAGCTAVLAAVPMAFQPTIWERYLKAGVAAIAINESRPDNGALLHLAQVHGVSTILAAGVIVSAALLLALVSRDTFWPTVWLMVALLPIAWTYSLLTLLPLGANILSRRPLAQASTALLVVAAGLTVGTLPAHEWPTIVIPIVVALAYVAILAAPVLEPDFSISLIGSWPSRVTILHRWRIPAAD